METCRILAEQYNGQIPRTREELEALPGVGRKTANVVLGHALGVPGLPVDRHVLRVSNRIGIAEGDDPVKVEAQLCAALQLVHLDTSGLDTLRQLHKAVLLKGGTLRLENLQQQPREVIERAGLDPEQAD
jgi:endonuclease III